MTHSTATKPKHLKTSFTRKPATTPFGQTLDRIVDRYELSYHTVAKRAGFEPNTFTRWRRGLRTPDRHSIGRLCQAIGTTPPETLELYAAAGLPAPFRDPAAAELVEERLRQLNDKLQHLHDEIDRLLYFGELPT